MDGCGEALADMRSECDDGDDIGGGMCSWERPVGWGNYGNSNEEYEIICKESFREMNKNVKQLMNDVKSMLILNHFG